MPKISGELARGENVCVAVDNVSKHKAKNKDKDFSQREEKTYEDITVITQTMPNGKRFKQMTRSRNSCKEGKVLVMDKKKTPRHQPTASEDERNHQQDVESEDDSRTSGEQKRPPRSSTSESSFGKPPVADIPSRHSSAHHRVARGDLSRGRDKKVSYRQKERFSDPLSENKKQHRSPHSFSSRHKRFCYDNSNLDSKHKSRFCHDHCSRDDNSSTENKKRGPYNSELRLTRNDSARDKNKHVSYSQWECFSNLSSEDEKRYRSRHSPCSRHQRSFGEDLTLDSKHKPCESHHHCFRDDGSSTEDTKRGCEPRLTREKSTLKKNIEKVNEKLSKLDTLLSPVVEHFPLALDTLNMPQAAVKGPDLIEEPLPLAPMADEKQSTKGKATSDKSSAPTALTKKPLQNMPASLTLPQPATKEQKPIEEPSSLIHAADEKRSTEKCTSSPPKIAEKVAIGKPDGPTVSSTKEQNPIHNTPTLPPAATNPHNPISQPPPPASTVDQERSNDKSALTSTVDENPSNDQSAPAPAPPTTAKKAARAKPTALLASPKKDQPPNKNTPTSAQTVVEEQNPISEASSLAPSVDEEPSKGKNAPASTSPPTAKKSPSDKPIAPLARKKQTLPPIQDPPIPPPSAEKAQGPASPNPPENKTPALPPQPQPQPPQDQPPEDPPIQTPSTPRILPLSTALPTSSGGPNEVLPDGIYEAKLLVCWMITRYLSR